MDQREWVTEPIARKSLHGPSADWSEDRHREGFSGSV